MEDNFTEDSLLRSEEIDEVIGRPPHWLIQWGISVFFIILLLVFALSYFIKYPEVITEPFIIKSDIKLTPVSVNENGQIIKIYVNDKDEAKKGDTLLVWKPDNTTSQQVVLLSPMAGIVSFISPVYNGQKVKQGQFLFFITPLKTTYSAVVQINGSAINKIKKGQHVDMNVQEYPDINLSGNITFISSLQNANGYFVNVDLTQSIEPADRLIKLTDGMTGSAQITIANRRLLEKFINKAR